MINTTKMIRITSGHVKLTKNYLISPKFDSDCIIIPRTQDNLVRIKGNVHSGTLIVKFISKSQSGTPVDALTRHDNETGEIETHVNIPKNVWQIQFAISPYNENINLYAEFDFELSQY